MLLLATTTTVLLLGVSGFSGIAMPVYVAAALLVGTVAAGLAFVARERAAQHPMISLDLFRNRSISLGLLGAHLTYFVLYAPLVLIPQLLIPLGYHERQVGPMLAALPIGFMVAALAGDRVLPSAKGKPIRAVVADALCGITLIVMATHPLDPNWLVPLLGVLGLCLGVVVPINGATVMSAASPSLTGTASGLLSMVRNVGTALGVAMVSLTLHLAGHDSRRSIQVRSGDDFVHVLHAGRWAFAVAAAVTVLSMSAAAALQFRRGITP